MTNSRAGDRALNLLNAISSIFVTAFILCEYGAMSCCFEAQYPARFSRFMTLARTDHTFGLRGIT